MENQREAQIFTSPPGKEHIYGLQEKQNRIFAQATSSNFLNNSQRSKSQVTLSEQTPDLLSKHLKEPSPVLVNEEKNERETFKTGDLNKSKTTHKTPNRLRIMDLPDNTKQSSLVGAINEISVLNLSPIKQVSSVVQSPSFRSPTSNLKYPELIKGSIFKSPKYLENNEDISAEGIRLGRNSQINFLSPHRGSSTHETYDETKNRDVKIESPDKNESWLAVMEKQRIDLQQLRDEERQKRRRQELDKVRYDEFQIDSRTSQSPEKCRDDQIRSPPINYKSNLAKVDPIKTKSGLCLTFAEETSSEPQVSMFQSLERNNIQQKEASHQLAVGRKTISTNQFKLVHSTLSQALNDGSLYASENSFENEGTTKSKKTFLGLNNLGSGSIKTNGIELNEKFDTPTRDNTKNRRVSAEQLLDLNQSTQRRTSLASNGSTCADPIKDAKVSNNILFTRNKDTRRTNRSTSNARSSYSSADSYTLQDDDCSSRLRTASFNPDKTRVNSNEIEYANTILRSPQAGKDLEKTLLTEVDYRLSNKAIISQLKSDHNDLRSKSNPRLDAGSYRTLNLPRSNDVLSSPSYNYEKARLLRKYSIIGQRPISIDLTSMKSPKGTENLKVSQILGKEFANAKMKELQDNQSPKNQAHSAYSTNLNIYRSKKYESEARNTRSGDKARLPSHEKYPKEGADRNLKDFTNITLEGSPSTTLYSDVKNKNLKEKFIFTAKNLGPGYRFLIPNLHNGAKAEPKQGKYSSDLVKQQWHKEKNPKHFLQESSQNIKKVEEILKRFRQQIN